MKETENEMESRQRGETIPFKSTEQVLEIRQEVTDPRGKDFGEMTSNKSLEFKSTVVETIPESVSTAEIIEASKRFWFQQDPAGPEQ